MLSRNIAVTALSASIGLRSSPPEAVRHLLQGVKTSIMSLRFSAANSSRIKKKTTAPAFQRISSANSPFSALQRRKPIQRSQSKPELCDGGNDDDDFFGDRLADRGLVAALSTDLTLRDVAQAMRHIQENMFSSMPQHASGMNSTRIADVLNFRKALPPMVTVAHVQAILNSATTTEREIADLVRGGAVRRVVVPGRGGYGDGLVLMADLDRMLGQCKDLTEDIKHAFTEMLHANPASASFPASQFRPEHVKALMQAGFLISASSTSWTATDVYSRPGDGSKGTMTSLQSISRAASGSMAAVGGEGAVHAAGGTGGGVKSFNGTGAYAVSLPAIGAFLRLLAAARAHMVSLLSKSKFREAPEDFLRERWEGGIAADNAASAARRNRGEFAGVLPGRTKKWKTFYGLNFTWVLEECVGAGLVEVFNTGSVGRGIRAI